MSNREQDNSNLVESTQGQAESKFIRWLDSFLDKLYRNHWEADPPVGIDGKIWGMPSVAPKEILQPAKLNHSFTARKMI